MKDFYAFHEEVYFSSIVHENSQLNSLYNSPSVTITNYVPSFNKSDGVREGSLLLIEITCGGKVFTWTSLRFKKKTVFFDKSSKTIDFYQAFSDYFRVSRTLYISMYIPVI